eukprot:5209171-Amphidinium_carterae.1
MHKVYLQQLEVLPVAYPCHFTIVNLSSARLSHAVQVLAVRLQLKPCKAMTSAREQWMKPHSNIKVLSCGTGHKKSSEMAYRWHATDQHQAAINCCP